MMNAQGRPAHVVLNALLLNLAPTYRGAGISHYQQQLLAGMARESRGSDLKITALVSDARWHPPTPLRVYRPRWPTHQPIARILWEQLWQANVLGRLQADLYHSLAFVGPQWGVRVPQVITVHDLSFWRYPQTLPAWKAFYLRQLTRRSIRRAARVIAVSESTRQDVLRWAQVPSERVVTVPNGVDARFRPLPSQDVAAWRARKGLPERFLLYLGTLQPRKNLETLLKAYARWRRQAPALAAGIPLILAGAKGWYYEHLFQLVDELGLSGAVHFAGYVPAQELPLWYNAATLFLYPSLFEGFGLPVLEAMACGTPVVVADTSSLPEMVADAGLILPPRDVDAWAQGIASLLTDEAYRVDLARRGQERARQFSWERTARETLAVYQDVLGGRA